MRLRARLARATAAVTATLALAGGLSGCMTVHGEEAVVPAATPEEAAAALDRYVDISNEAKGVNDAERNKDIEDGGLGAIDFAGLTARHDVYGEDDPDFEPLAVSDTEFHIPQQAAWPKFFVADTATNQGHNRWLMFFTRDSVDEDWRVTYLSSLPAAQIPEFAEDEDGYLEDIPVGEESGLAIEPSEISTAYTVYLQSETGPFAAGPYTSETRANRDQVNSGAQSLTEFRDSPPDLDENPDYAPLAMRLADGSAFVMFTTQHDQRLTMASGEVIPAESIGELTAALMEEDPEDGLEWMTLHLVGIQAAVVPQGEGEVQVIGQIKDAVAAEGH
ncbi:hypothetical protein [Streptomyces sp. RFCAC02]|uniref:hypothetical protein n=1 Tax=Streptomyces sp. RFCAC02 TaxID=2499143 RepID=UPI00101F749A|nr:hypothetical protein [Streptomyces sp. RFCAC02]